jgi:hypothetical protein
VTFRSSASCKNPVTIDHSLLLGGAQVLDDRRANQDALGLKPLTIQGVPSGMRLEFGVAHSPVT